MTVGDSDWRPRFFTIWTGQAVSRFGSQVVSFALIWWLTEKTGSVAVLTVASLMTLLPPVFLGPVAGALVDRWDRRKVLMVSDSTIALFSGILAFLYWRGIAEPWHIYGVMLVRAIGDSFHGPSTKASTTLMVPKEHLSRVAGMNQALNGALRIAAPPLGAVLLKALPIHLVVLVDMATAAFAVVPLFFIPIPRPAAAEGTAGKRGVLRETAEGIRYVLSRRSLAFIVLSCAVTNLSYGPVFAYGSLLVRNVFHGGALELGLVSSASGIGLIAGGLLMSVWGGFRRKLATSAVGWIGVGIGYMALLLIPDDGVYVYIASKLFVGMMVPIGSAPLDAWYQSHTAPDKQGRLFAVLSSLDQLSMPFGLVVGGLLGDAVPLRAWWVLMGVQHALLGVAWLLLPVVRRAEKEE